MYIHSCECQCKAVSETNLHVAENLGVRLLASSPPPSPRGPTTVGHRGHKKVRRPGLNSVRRSPKNAVTMAKKTTQPSSKTSLTSLHDHRDVDQDPDPTSRKQHVKFPSLRKLTPPCILCRMKQSAARKHFVKSSPRETEFPVFLRRGRHQTSGRFQGCVE